MTEMSGWGMSQSSSASCSGRNSAVPGPKSALSRRHCGAVSRAPTASSTAQVPRSPHR